MPTVKQMIKATRFNGLMSVDRIRGPVTWPVPAAPPTDKAIRVSNPLGLQPRFQRLAAAVANASLPTER